MNSGSMAPGQINGSTSYPRRLEGKVAIITGGARGIGESMVRVFWENGAKVVIDDILDDVGQALCDQLDNNVTYVHCDISNEDDMHNLVVTTVDKYGKLDIMCSNAGIVDKVMDSILSDEKSDLERIIGVNLVGGFLGAKHAARVMVPQRSECILLTASACTAIAGLGSHPYTASKHAIVGLAKNVAAELGQHGIRVNCISPSGIVTNIGQVVDEDKVKQYEAMMSNIGNLKGSILRTTDVANAALYLASDEGKYVSGLNLVVDGGYSIVNPSVVMALSQLRKHSFHNYSHKLSPCVLKEDVF